jgi:hypothetical protein
VLTTPHRKNWPCYETDAVIKYTRISIRDSIRPVCVGFEHLCIVPQNSIRDVKRSGFFQAIKWDIPDCVRILQLEKTRVAAGQKSASH